MEIIKTDITEQTIKVIPRELLTSVRFFLVDKQNEDNFIDLITTATVQSEFITIPFTVNFFKEGGKYFIKVYNLSDERIWQGHAFCTDQTDLQNYDINE